MVAVLFAKALAEGKESFRIGMHQEPSCVLFAGTYML